MSYAKLPKASNADAVKALAEIVAAENVITAEATPEGVAEVKRWVLAEHPNRSVLYALRTLAWLWKDLQRELGK